MVMKCHGIVRIGNKCIGNMGNLYKVQDI
jgi:hypothetical protein